MAKYKTKTNYYVIGGEKEFICYGGTKTLLGARRLATRNEEFWEKERRWRKPRIYKAEDTEVIEINGRTTTEDGLITVRRENPLREVWECQAYNDIKKNPIDFSIGFLLCYTLCFALNLHTGGSLSSFVLFFFRHDEYL